MLKLTTPAGFSDNTKTWRKKQHATDDLDPSAAFLFQTLVSRPTLLHRNAVPYIALRRWRVSAKPFQIDALRILKKSPPPRFVSAIVADIMEALDPMISSALYRFVVPIPCSRSAPDSCLSILIAERLASRLQLVPIHALAIEPAEGLSHPKTNLSRPSMRLQKAVEGPVIVVDDVATSGAHIEEAVRLLRPTAKAVFAVTWIGGVQDSE